ncbi:MAG TPA: phosphonomutase, partial [Firmicutes bacterium]|nr:phosphonomutase [Bacillota bacterium]
ISSKMEATNALIGGESSGGLTIRGHILGKDGIFAASLLIELLSVTGKNLSELLAEINQRFGYYYMVEKNLHFTLEDRSRLVKKIFANKELPDFGYDIHHVNYQDGVK